MVTVRIVDVLDDAAFRAGPAVRGPGLRPPLVRLLGGRRPGVEGRAPLVAGAHRRRSPSRDPRPRSPRTRSSPSDRRRPRSTRSRPRPSGDPEPVPRRRRRRRANPFAPPPQGRPVGSRGARKLALLRRGPRSRAVRQGPDRDDEAAAYCQFGPLTAYPRAQRTRDLYPQLARRAAAGGHHLHRDDRRGPRLGPAAPAGRGGLRRPGRSRVRGGRDVPGDRPPGPTRRARRRRRFWEPRASSVAVDDPGSRSCAASSGDAPVGSSARRPHGAARRRPAAVGIERAVAHGTATRPVTHGLRRRRAHGSRRPTVRSRASSSTASSWGSCPASVAGTPIEPDPVTAGEVAADPSLGQSASAIAMGI